MCKWRLISNVRWPWLGILYAPIRAFFIEMTVANISVYAPIRVQFLLKMCLAKLSLCTNQSSISAGDGRGQDFCMHQSEFNVCWRWAWPRFLYAPIRVQCLLEMGMAKISVCTNQSSISTGDRLDNIQQIQRAASIKVQVLSDVGAWPMFQGALINVQLPRCGCDQVSSMTLWDVSGVRVTRCTNQSSAPVRWVWPRSLHT